MSSQLVSVIVLNFNGEKILRRCLDHLLAQTYPHMEIIVVDNASSDGSLAILEEYFITGRVSVVRSKKNVGVPGGRNLGLYYARGAIVAFMDNDGYASPTWLEETVRTFESDGHIGAVASVVFFNKKKLVLNGAGGTINFQGFGGDHCFHVPYEFAETPREVLFPMGCGMIVRASVMRQIGALDPLLFNYYDDVEVGIRIWRKGFKVVVSPNAWVDHDFSYSDRMLQNKAYLCERNRIRTVLKYYPAVHLLWWLLHEPYIFRHLQSPSFWTLPFKAWAWNLLHLGSALAWRVKFRSCRHSFWHLLDPSWRSFPPPRPNTLDYRPDPGRAGSRLVLDGVEDRHQLNFGWYFAEQDGSINYRWTEARASAFVKLIDPVSFMSIRFRSQRAQQVISVVLRQMGDLEPAVRFCIDSAGHAWQEKAFECSLRAGCYEVLLSIDEIIRDSMGRTLGLAVNSIEFV